jgi:hypothetical protein
MSCQETEKISLLIDGELAPAQARDVELHITTCDECHQARMDFLVLRNQLNSYASARSQSLQPALAQLLKQPKTAEQESTPGLLEGLGFTWFAPGFTAIAVTVLAALTIGALAFFVYLDRTTNGPTEIANKVESTSNPIDRPQQTDGGTAALPSDPTEVAGAKDRKSPKGQRQTSPKTKPDARQKQNPERSAPPPQPLPQRSVAPPTWTGVIADDPTTSVATNSSEEIGTLRHLQQSEHLLRSFRNVRYANKNAEVSYERRRARRLVYRNILLRREAEDSGDVQVAALLGSLEPILIDIANLREKAQKADVRAIQDRMERQSLVALLQVNSAAVARANE